MNGDMKSDLAVVISEVRSLTKAFDDYREENRGILSSLTVRVNTLETKQASTDQRVSIFTVFQSALAIVIGAIATYLGRN